MVLCLFGVCYCCSSIGDGGSGRGGGGGGSILIRDGGKFKDDGVLAFDGSKISVAIAYLNCLNCSLPSPLPYHRCVLINHSSLLQSSNAFCHIRF